MNKILNHLKENWVRHGFETLVVTVGILGAFALNNWNDQTKKNTLEVETLREIQLSLKSNLEHINGIADNMKKDVSKLKTLVIHLQTRKPYVDSLEELFYYPYRGHIIIVNKSAYEMLENRGIDIISNIELRSKIVDHYNYRLKTMELFGEAERALLDDFRNYYQTKVVPNYDDLFVGHTGREYPRTFAYDYEEILNDITLINKLKWRISRLDLAADRLDNTWATSTQALENEIGEWLKNK